MPEFLSLSFVEIIIILFLAFLLLKPTEIQSVGKWFGKMLREIVTSDGWKMFQQTSRELRTLPLRLMRQANDEQNDELNKIKDELNQIKDDIKSSAQFKNSSREIPLRPQRAQVPPPISAPHSDLKGQVQDSSSEKESQKDEGWKNE